MPFIFVHPAMLLTQAYVEEFLALRNLERAIRACGLPSIMISGQEQLDSLAAALKAIEEARAARTTDCIGDPGNDLMTGESRR